MIKAKNLLTGMLAVLAVLLLTGCWEKDNPSRTSLDVDTSTLTLSVGETAVRMATSKAEDAAITYTSSNPAVATVDQFGKVTALTEGTATITIDMAETKKSWYAAKTLTYSVVVKNVSAQALANVDKATPLTLVAQADGKITVTFNNGITLTNDIKYTINNGAEQTIAKNTSGSFDIEVKKGDVVQLYSLNTSLGGGAVAGARGTTRAVDSGAKYINIRPSMKTEIYGNVMSLLKGKDNLESATALEAKNAFYGLFAGAEKLVNNTERLLVLPATTLTEGCYQDMFNGCKGIEKAPELPAPKLEKNCYQEMFYDCAKLNHVKCLASDITAENSTKDWLGKAGTEATGEKVLETITPMKADSDDGVPESWTDKKIVLVTGIKLDADEMKLSVGNVGTLKATVEPTDATEKTITWTSDKPSIATVDANGNVTGVAAGTATITATAGDKTATCKVTVSAKPTVWDGDLAKLTNESTEEFATATDGMTITGTLTANVKVSIADGATITFDNATINGVNNESYKWAGITCLGDATIILKDGTENTVKGFHQHYPGIQAGPTGKTLTIQGTGSLEASSNGYGAAGIGGGRLQSCGNITITGGTVTATGGDYAAGIGSGNGNGETQICGDIEISGGTVEATGGAEAAGIGSGSGGVCGTVTITSGVTSVKATKGDGAPNSIGRGLNGKCGTVTIGGKEGAISTSPYTYPLTYPVALSAVTSDYVGSVVTTDGNVYATAKDATDAGKTAVAKICYVGSSTGVAGYTHGLALALTDEASTRNWTNATGASGAAAHTPAAPTTTSSWMLPSKDQWNNMITGAGGYTALRNGFTSVGGSNLWSESYWSSTGFTTTDAWGYSFGNGGWFPLDKNRAYRVRACLAF